MTHKCELCGDQPKEIFIHGRCHLTAPLEASIINGWIILRCYIPTCRREIARFELKESQRQEEIKESHNITE